MWRRRRRRGGVLAPVRGLGPDAVGQQQLLLRLSEGLLRGPDRLRADQLVRVRSTEPAPQGAASLRPRNDLAERACGPVLFDGEPMGAPGPGTFGPQGPPKVCARIIRPSPRWFRR